MAFISCNNGNLLDVFITEADIIDQFVGNQLWTWGFGANGRLGNNNTINVSSPVQTISTATNWVQVSATSCLSAAIKTDGTLWLWGQGTGGGLGNNSVTDVSSPVQTVTTGTNWKQVSTALLSASCSVAAAIKTDGTLWLWGGGGGGRLGNNNTIDVSSPVQTVTTGTNWKQVNMGSSFTSAVKTDGTLWLWGCGSFGQLGNNNTINVSSPVQTVTTGTNWKQVSLGSFHSAAVKTDGTLWLWGSGATGRLGTNSTSSRSSPVQTITTGINWKQVSIGFSHSAAIKTDGTLWLWGDGGNGTLGTNAASSRSSPVQTVSIGTNWKQVSTQCLLTGAIKTDGTLWLWGSGSCGALGNNATSNRSSPVQTVATGTNWKQVSVGGLYGAAITHTEN